MQKPELFYFDNHFMFFSEYEPAESHRHLASHLIIALDEKMEWIVAGEKTVCRGIYIDSGIEHVCKGKGRYLTFLFLKTSSYACSAEENLLKGRSYAALDDDVVDEAIKISEKFYAELKTKDSVFFDREILELCKISKDKKRQYDDRIQKTIDLIEKAETIEPEIVDKLKEVSCLSKSRFLHLFKEQTQMTLASYLAFEKLRKTYHYILKGNNITESCMKAGFDTPSHCAATCKKMFGISLKKIAFI